MYKNVVKRLLDILISGVAIVVLAVPMLLIALIIKLDDAGPVIFKQERIGRKGKTFYIYKFRSMRVNAEHTGSGVYSAKGDPRVTRIGKILRATSLDELPQFFNVLRGDMSFIGPRPPLTYHPWTYDKYTEEQKHMFDVRPGITGWAQVNGRKTVEWNERIRFSCWYVENISLKLDMQILFKTFIQVIKNADNANEGATVNSGEKGEAKELSR